MKQGWILEHRSLLQLTVVQRTPKFPNKIDFYWVASRDTKINAA